MMRIHYNDLMPCITLSLLAIPLFFLNVHDVHLWGDDFSQYIKEAQNIATGKPFHSSSYVFNKYNTTYAPPQYPPGFPLLLAPVVKMWGLSIKAMGYFNSVICTCLLFSLFYYFRKYTGVVAAVCMSVLILYSGLLIDLKQQILSDIPGLLFITLYLTIRNNPTHTPGRISLLILCATMAVLIRTQAIFIIVAESVYWILSQCKTMIRQKKVRISFSGPSLYIIAGTLLLLFFFNRIIFPSPVSAESYYSNFITVAFRESVFHIITTNISFVRIYLAGLFYYDTYNALFNNTVFVVCNAAFIAALMGFLISIRKRLSVDDIFFALICLLVIFLHQVRSQRFTLPVMPVLFYYCYVTARFFLAYVPRFNARILAVAVTLLYLRIGYAYLKSTIHDPPDVCIPKQRDIQAFNYLSQHVNDSDIIVFDKPRVIALYTNRRSMVPDWSLSKEKNKHIFDSMKVKYMLVYDDFGDTNFAAYLTNTQQPIDSVRIADGYTLYTLR